jgi:oxygen-independent coproporphyrinogen-3 oxidase
MGNQMKSNGNLLTIEYLSKKYDEANIPLYLSYPISSCWADDPTQEDLIRSFDPDMPPFLYFHFPYCRNTCYYCVCYKLPYTGPLDSDLYLGHIEKEFQHKREILGVETFKKVRHMHWGGGTPTLMSQAQIERFHNTIARHIDVVQDERTSISIEAFPDKRDLNGQKLRLLRDMGFNEISLGVQDFDETVQKAINRDTPFHIVQEMVLMARELGFRVHIDICYGLPFQGINELKKTVSKVIRLAPDRVALFTYAHYPLAFPLQRKIPLSAIPNSFYRTLMNMAASEMFAENGYGKVGYDHFAKKNNALYTAMKQRQVIRDFMGYSVEDRRQFIGFGLSAISFVGRTFFHNMINLNDYAEAVTQAKLPVQPRMGHTLTDDDAIRNILIQKDIMGNFKIPKRAGYGSAPKDFDDYFTKELPALQSLEKDGLVEAVADNIIRLTPVGRYFARHVAHVFDTYQS